MNIPSIKRLCENLKIDKETAQAARRIMAGEQAKEREENPGKYAATIRWISSCYNRPSAVSIRLNMLNDLLGGFGVECSGDVDIHKGAPLEYINAGDTYTATICLFRGRWILSSWGDIVEKHEKLFSAE